MKLNKQKSIVKIVERNVCRALGALPIFNITRSRRDHHSFEKAETPHLSFCEGLYTTFRVSKITYIGINIWLQFPKDETGRDCGTVMVYPSIMYNGFYTIKEMLINLNNVIIVMWKKKFC